MTTHLHDVNLNLALKLDNEFVGHLARYFTGLLTADRAALAVQRLALGYTLISMVIIINIYGYFGVVMSALRDIAREFTQTQDLLKFVPVEIRQSISKEMHHSKSKNRGQSNISWIMKVSSIVLRHLRRVPLICTGLLLAISAVCITSFTEPALIWQSIIADPSVAAAAACDAVIATWTPFGYGLTLNTLNFGTQQQHDLLKAASHFGQVAALSIAVVMNAIMGQPIDLALAVLGTGGAIMGNVLSYFLVDGFFESDLISLATIGFFISFSLTMGIAQRYLSAKTFKKIQNITGMDYIDVFLFGVIAGMFSFLNGTSAGALLFFMVDCFFQLHYSVGLPTCILVGALDSLFLLGFHRVMDISYVDFSDKHLLNIILPIVFLSSPLLCYLNARSQGKYFKEYMVLVSIAAGVYVASSASGVGAWISIYVFLCTMVIWFPVCASTAVGGTIRSAAFEDI